MALGGYKLPGTDFQPLLVSRNFGVMFRLGKTFHIWMVNAPVFRRIKGYHTLVDFMREFEQGELEIVDWNGSDGDPDDCGSQNLFERRYTITGRELGAIDTFGYGYR